MSHIIKFNGHADTMSGWARKQGIAVHTLQNRFRSGWTIERALTVPVRSRPIRRTAKPTTSLSAGTVVKNMMRADLAQRRELTRMLRQFSRDFAVIMERSMHRGWSATCRPMPRTGPSQSRKI